MSSQKKILVIEDSLEHREILAEALSFLNFEVKCLSDGSRLTELMEAFRPHLILIDYILPGQNGVLISRNLKMNYRTAHIPVILMSAYYFESTEYIFADEFIPKPIDLYFLEQKICDLTHNTLAKISGNDSRHFSSSKMP